MSSDRKTQINVIDATTVTPEASAVGHAASADGTTIAYEAYGTGPVVAVVGGAMCLRSSFRDLAQALGERGFTGVTYDRRGRGDSTDTQPYAVQREVEDLTAVIEAAREGAQNGAGVPAYAHGISSGGALVVQAVAAGALLTAASALEIPYREPSGAPQPHNYIGRLRALVEADDRAGILRLFHCEAVGMPQERFDQMKGTPAWEAMLSIAPTALYDGLCLGGDDVTTPHGLLARVTVPFLTISSSGTMMPALHDAPAITARALPLGEHVELEGGFHEVPATTMAGALGEFYSR
ncbi:MAG: alpha/beta fold hydrolase [Terracoccus sp.]